MTIPVAIQEILDLQPGSTLLLKVTKNGVLISPAEIIERPAYTAKEWSKIEKLVAGKGKVYKTTRSAKKHLQA